MRSPASLVCALGAALAFTHLTGCESMNGHSAIRPAALSEHTIEDHDQALLHVRGMSCPKCVTNVDLQLLALPGVQSAHVDMGAGTVLVTFTDESGKPRPSKRDLARAVERSGFTLAGIDLLNGPE